MGANWKTNLFGLLAGLAGMAHATGVSVGHVGSTDVLGAIAGISTMLLGFYAKDKNVSGGTVANDILWLDPRRYQVMNPLLILGHWLVKMFEDEAVQVIEERKVVIEFSGTIEAKVKFPPENKNNVG